MESAASATTSAQARRTNPSRSKRGGPGVGTSDVDVMILESYKRKLETEPLIPADTPFFLTTNSASVPDDLTSIGDPAISINIVANDRYFDRPEVLKASRAQESIQTPEFWPISESSSVGGRFRPRGAEDEREETSDAAYEKRHKKFETFEKRQRLREKDKLKHEHYKLKERIEQLRSMDTSAFMALPFSFGIATEEVSVNAEVDVATDTAAQAQANGTAPLTEGERRKKAMLEHAIGLEKRYSYLLPPDRVRKTQGTHVEEEESDTERALQVGSSKNESIKFRLPARSSLSATPVSSPAATKPPRKGRGQGKQSASARAVPARVSSSVPPADQTPSASSPYIDVEMHTPEPRLLSPPPPSLPPTLPVELPEVPAAVASAPLPKAPVAVRQPNGRGRPRKNAQLLQNNMQTGAAVLEPAEKVEKADKVPLKKKLRMRPVQVQIADEGESEKAPSDDGHVEIQEVTVNEEEVQPDQQQQNEIPEVDGDTYMLSPDEVAPELRELFTRLEQTGVAGSPPPAEIEEAEIDELHHEQYASEGPPPEDSISAPPAKRQKKMSAKRRAQSSAHSMIQSASQSQIERTPSMPPIASAHIVVSQRRKKTMTPRGQQSATYISSITGQKVVTTSFLLLAAIRSESAKRNVEKRHNTSFGIPTPTFKESFDFEIPEWMHYPEDEEPMLPTSDLDPPHFQNSVDNVGQGQTEPSHPATEEPELPEPVSISMDRLPEEEIPISALREEPPSPGPSEPLQPVQTEVNSLQEAQVVPNEVISEPEDEQIANEPPQAEEEEEEEEEDEIRSPTEHESEPGVSIRVLSQPKDSDEELEW
ncbi:hypothetical protein BDN70DRAFT_870005 [Pholiota conissans]|uniref:PEHE domain-containing protein n=1 Tax=Pholiota conissans TaxID=109636 RepID=A0A9P6D861_9AGAR|nr:hypothetical protein BDN70DRAFT_870005 [Pholiota conissans]